MVARVCRVPNLINWGHINWGQIPIVLSYRTLSGIHGLRGRGWTPHRVRGDKEVDGPRVFARGDGGCQGSCCVHVVM
jgi:hypothetical protein